MKRHFHKMHGLGNDFVILDAREEPLEVTPSLARAIADRRTGVGCDQLIVLEKAEGADARARFWNADGEEVGACGIGTRCVGWLLMQSTGRDQAVIETAAGRLVLSGAFQDAIGKVAAADRIGARRDLLWFPSRGGRA